METAQVARILSEMGTLLELSGENAFRCRAYHNAAEALRAMPSDLSEMIGDGRLAGTPGIGSAMFGKIAQLVATGRLNEYEALKAKMPPGLTALLRVPGLGPKKIKALRDELNISSLDDLKTAAESGLIAKVKGFGAKTQTTILEGIGFIQSVGDRTLQHHARRLAAPLLEAVRSHPHVIRAEICGSLRRGAETIGDLDILFSSNDPGPVLAMFANMPQTAKVLAHGPTKISIRLPQGVQCDLRGVDDEQFPFAQHYFTGSKAHNVAMRKRAIARGWKLNEYGLESEAGPIACKTETDLFAALGLAWIPPELREDLGELDLAERNQIPKLVERADLQGTFHCHTDWSDGGNTLEEMAEAARCAGLNYLGIADHSRSAGYAGGLSIDRVRQQWQAIDALNARYAGEFRIFKGIESDILLDGSLDYPDDVLAGFDYIVASVHSAFRVGREAMTQRMIKAVTNPYTTILGHPTGRLLLQRDSYEVDLDQVIAAAAQSGCWIEINADPHRLDLDSLNARKAIAMGVKPLAINPDAHTIGGFEYLDYGVAIARRAGLTASRILNASSREEAEARLAERRP